MIARTPFDVPTLTPLDALDLAALPPGTTLERTIDGTIFYRVEWVVAVRDTALHYVGDMSAIDTLSRLSSITDEVARLQQQLADLAAEQQGLRDRLLPTAAPAPKPVRAPKPSKPAPTATKAMVRCAVDGCEVEKEYGTSIAIHRKQKHPEWFQRQMALPNDHPLKADRTGAILLWEAAQTEQLPPVKELAAAPVPEVAPEVAPVVPFDQSPA